MKNFFLTFFFFLFLISPSVALEKSELIKKHGSIGYGDKKLNYNFGCFIDTESYDETLYNRLVETLGPYSFGYKLYDHPKGKLMLLNPWNQDNLFYDLPRASTYAANKGDNLTLISPELTGNTGLVLNFLEIEPDKVMLYRSTYKFNANVGNKFMDKFNKYYELLKSSNDDAVEVLEDLKFDLLKYTTKKNTKKEIEIIYSCNQW